MAYSDTDGARLRSGLELHLHEYTDEEIRDISITICDKARDVDDATELLATLGLIGADNRLHPGHNLDTPTERGGGLQDAPE